jgi:HK97 family phage portal protein
MQDAQYIETRRFQKAEIATILGIPSHFINEMGDAKYNNVENTNTQFVQYTIMSYVNKFEIENKKLLRTAQRDNHKWKYNVNGLMRGDMATRSDYYAKMIQNSVLKPSEVRRLEDMTGGIDDYLISANNQIPFSKLDEVLSNNNKRNEAV